MGAEVCSPGDSHTSGDTAVPGTGGGLRPHHAQGGHCWGQEAARSQIMYIFFFFFLYTAWNEAKNLGLESLSRQLIIAERQFVKQERLLICKSSSILIVSFKLKEVELIEIDWK